MSKQIELEILEAVLKHHLKRPLQYLCLKISRECEERGLEYECAVALALREEILPFLDGEGSVEDFVNRTRGVGSGDIPRQDPEVVAMRTRILKTMIARRKS